MKLASSFCFLALFSLATVRAQDGKPKEPTPDKPAAAATPAAPAPAMDKALMEKVSYYFGTRVAGDFAQSGLEVSVESFSEGFKDGLAKKSPGKYPEAELEAAMGEFQKFMASRQQAQMEKMQSEMSAAGPKNLEAGKKFLEENGKKEGVVTTKSGLQYQVLKAAEGKKPAATDTVKVHYHGTFLDGSVFDSSVDRGEPVSFPLNQVIAGWTEGLQLMPVGSKYKFFIPGNLAYGENGNPPRIQPNSSLIFEVELLAIEAPQK